MLLGGTIAGSYRSPEEWERMLAASGFKAVTARLRRAARTSRYR